MAVKIIGRAFGWLGRRLALYVVLVAAIGFATFALPWIKREIEGDRQARQRYEALNQSHGQLEADIDAARRRLIASLDATRQQGLAAIDDRIAVATQEKTALEQAARNAPSTFVLALRGSDARLIGGNARRR
jgi:hypothetical protein